MAIYRIMRGMRTTIILDDDTRAEALAIAQRYGLETVSDGIRLAVAEVSRQVTAEAEAARGSSLAARVARIENRLGIGE